MLLGNGNGTFRGQPVTLLPTSFAAAAGDFNGDGNPDLAVTSSTGLNILLGDGAGSFAVAHTYSASGNSIAYWRPQRRRQAGSWRSLQPTLPTTGALTVMLGNGDGTFGPPTVYQQGMVSGSLPVLIADLRGDHKPYVLTLQGDSLVVFPNNGDGTFGTPISYFAGSAASGVVVSDFNSDGKLDAAVSSSAGIGILLGNGDGTFQGATFTATGGNAFSIETGDFNNDGKADLVVGFQVFLGNGNGTFTALPESLASVVIGVADFNGDGNLDLLEGGCPFSTAQFSIWCVQLGIGNGTFGNPVTITTSSDMTSGFNVIADFNRDQKPDIAIDLSPVVESFTGRCVYVSKYNPARTGRNCLSVGPDFSIPSGWDKQFSCRRDREQYRQRCSHSVGGQRLLEPAASEFSQTNNCVNAFNGGRHLHNQSCFRSDCGRQRVGNSGDHRQCSGQSAERRLVRHGHGGAGFCHRPGLGIFEFCDHRRRTSGILQSDGFTRRIIQWGGESELRDHARSHACAGLHLASLGQRDPGRGCASGCQGIHDRVRNLRRIDFVHQLPDRSDARQLDDSSAGLWLAICRLPATDSYSGRSADRRGVSCHARLRGRRWKFVVPKHNAGYSRRNIHGHGYRQVGKPQPQRRSHRNCAVDGTDWSRASNPGKDCDRVSKAGTSFFSEPVLSTARYTNMTW